jgi:PAS domain S-box-containing protein
VNGHWRGETIGVRADGSTFVEDHTLASTDEGELVCTIQDITEHKDRKQELKKKKRRYQAVFHDPNILVGLLDTTGTVLEINETAMGYVDVELADVAGEPFWETPWFTGDEAIQETIRHRVEQAATGEYVEFEVDLSETVDEQLIVNGVIRPVTNDDDEVVSLLVSDRDITERKQREQELELKNRAMDEAPVGVVISDPARDDNPITYANDRFKQLTGYDEDEILGRNCRFLQGEATDSEPVATMRNAIDDQEPVTVELRNYRKDGTEFWTRVSIAPVKNEAGDVTRFVGFQQDISEWRQ